MAFKMKGSPMQRNFGIGGSPLNKETRMEGDRNVTSTTPTTPATPAKPKTWKDAYKTRDMKTYGKLTESEYITEAKRQKKDHKKTGKWDHKNAPKVTEGPKSWDKMLNPGKYNTKKYREVEAKDYTKTTKTKDRDSWVPNQVVDYGKKTTETMKTKDGTTRTKTKGATSVYGAKVEGKKVKTRKTDASGNVTNRTKTKFDTKGNQTKTKSITKKDGMVTKTKTTKRGTKTKTRKQSGAGFGGKIKGILGM
tara:strand:- start:72 stop:821 length:750 start_codon:yes stop_codon:yes gene_type:complete